MVNVAYIIKGTAFINFMQIVLDQYGIELEATVVELRHRSTHELSSL